MNSYPESFPLSQNLLSANESDNDLGIKKIMLSSKDQGNLQKYLQDSQQDNQQAKKQFNQVRQNMKRILYNSITNSIRLNLFFTLSAFLKFVVTFACLVAGWDSRSDQEEIYILLCLTGAQNLLKMIHHFVIIYLIATRKQNLISRVASNYHCSILQSTQNNQMGKTISVDQLLKSDMDRKKTIDMLRSKHSHQNIMQLQKESNVMQNDIKQSHFSQQVLNQHRFIKYLGHFCNILYLVIFICSNVLIIFKDYSITHKTLYILLILHLVNGYILLVFMILLLMTTAIASPFILVAFVYKKINKQIKKNQSLKVIASLKLENYDQMKHPENKCTICLNNFYSQQQVYSLKCSHYFHKDCLQQWFMMTSQCPVCRDDHFQINNIIND